MVIASVLTRSASHVLPVVLLAFCCLRTGAETVRIDSEVIRDKIKGGWVGQTVGCTYGGPTEFRWVGTPIPEDVPIAWSDTLMAHYYKNAPGLYDDIYVDLTFLTTLDSLGLDASVEALALRFANAGYRLWHANQIARLNILSGMMPPESGHYRNNPHADDLDFQIESDFIGLTCPGLPAVAAEYADRVGHIMAYGDGVYGGVFVSALYCHAFTETEIETGFDGLVPARRTDLEGYALDRPFTAAFEGRAFVLHGRMAGYRGWARCTVHIDGRLIEDITLRGDLYLHRFPFFWNYDLKDGSHTLEIRKLNGDGLPQLYELVIYR